MEWITDLLPGLGGVLNIHPMLVHFPVVLLPIACLLHFLAPKLDATWIAPAARWALWAGTLSAGIAIATGYLAADGLGHDKPGHDLVHDHRNLMVATGILALVVSGLVFRLHARTDRTSRWILGVAHLALTGLLIFGSDRGAALVYRYGFGVQQEPTSATEHADGEDHNPEETVDDHSSEPGHSH